MQNGFIHIYCGDGKGKTTAALGLALRCSGRGFKACVAAFLKDFDSGEYLNDLPFDVIKYKGVCGFWNELSDEDKNIAKVEMLKYFDEVTCAAVSKKYDLLVLDEIIVAINLGCIKIGRVVDFLINKPEKLEIVLTGANPPQRLAEIADYISEVKNIKHPYEKGINAREGIEF